MNLRDLHHCVAGELVIRKELNPVAVFDFRLSQAFRATLEIEGIGDRELRHLYHRAVRIRVDHRIRKYPSLVITTLTNRINALAIEFAITTRPLGFLQREPVLRFAATRCELKRNS